MSRPSQDARQYAYDRLHACIRHYPNQRKLLKYVDHKPISPSVFDITNPEHVCDAAYFGIPLLPYDEKSFKASVAPGGAFTRIVDARIRDVEVRIQKINSVGLFMGFQIKYDRKKPLPMQSLELMRPMLGDFIDLVPQFEKDREYVNSGHAARLDHFAHEYRQPNLGAMLAFFRRLDEVAGKRGYGSFAHLCVPTRFMDYLTNAHAENAGMQEALEKMQVKRDQLKKESPYIIEMFLKSHARSDLPYCVDMRDEELFIEMRYASYSVEEYIKSEFISNDDTGRLLASMTDFMS
ncbi:hypothetical protein [Polaromonas hydrogenivorans]|uniref:Uncharacterized protein n=1 Tax=Polaromonas hydrogenivorans TaxID=335476 RepID=A0AAU7M0A0_9BURK